MAMSPRLLRPSASGFTPRSITGLALWLDASDASTLFQDAAATTPATATSDPVGAWLDKSGNARHATQSTAGSRPTISATALNGKKQLGLISQHLRGPSTTWTGSASIYWVGRTGQSANGAFVFGDGTTDQTDGFHAGWLNTAGVGAYGNGWQSGNAPRAESPSAWRNADIVAGVTLSSTEAIARVNGATTNTTAALTGSLSQSAAAQFYIGRESSGTWNNINGSLAELLIYQPALNASQRLMLERHLAAKWGITLAPQVSNADAQDWINRVYANGGTVSSSTAAAVNQFCVDIEAASLRNRFYRLNLFCGGTSGTTAGLAACLVPLYRGPSLGGTQYGNTIDSNQGPFSATDYAETGGGGGLLGNGSNKYLSTGLSVNDMGTAANGHMSVYHGQSSGANSNRYYMGANDATTGNRFYLGTDAFSTASVFGSYGAVQNASQTLAAQGHGPAGHRILSRESDSLLTHYHNGSVVATNTTTITPAVSTAAFAVFAANRNGTVDRFHNSWIAAYSIGLGLNSTQAANYRTIMQTFQAALGRNV